MRYSNNDNFPCTICRIRKVLTYLIIISYICKSCKSVSYCLLYKLLYFHNDEIMKFEPKVHNIHVFGSFAECKFCIELSRGGNIPDIVLL